ncbi:hypothetical protein Tco_1083811 [Tanacetum coccineum]
MVKGDKLTRKGKTVTYSNCKGIGHNKIGCKAIGSSGGQMFDMPTRELVGSETMASQPVASQTVARKLMTRKPVQNKSAANKRAASQIDVPAIATIAFKDSSSAFLDLSKPGMIDTERAHIGGSTQAKIGHMD